MRLEYSINPRGIGFILGIISFYLAVQSIIFEFLIENVLDQKAHRTLILIIDLFSVNAELTIPTWYSALLLFIAAGLLMIIATAKHNHQGPYTRHWAALGAIFLFMSMDEGAAIHEILADAIQREIALTGYLYFGWQIVAAPLVILFALVYLRFLLHLPPRTRAVFILAGLIYVGGALIGDAVSANQLYWDGEINFRYLAIGTVEELMEMLGTVVFIYALSSYIVNMEYTLIFRKQLIIQGAGGSTNSLHQFQSFLRQRSVILIAVLILGLNFSLVAWALMQPSSSEPLIENSDSSIPAIINQLIIDDVVTTYMSGQFGDGNLSSLQVVASLLDIYDEVTVITLPLMELSIALAGHKLPFDRNSLSEVLRTHGEMQFVIFDTPAVRAVVGGYSN